MVQLPINSNFVNGIYSSVEVLLTILYLQLLRILLSCHNIWKIYDKRKPLFLKTTRLAMFFDPGLAPTRYISSAVLSVVLFVALTTTGGFSFVGTTEPVHEVVRVRNKVVAATNGSYINFRDHVSSDGLLISASVVLLQRRSCLEQDSNRMTLYSWVNDLQDLTSVIWPRGTLFVNSTCIRSQNGFKDEVIGVLKSEPARILIENCELDFLKVGVNFSQIGRNEITQIPFSEDQELGDCPFRILELWCSNFIELRCVGSLRIDDEAGGFGEIIYFISPNRGLSAAVSLYRARERDDTELLKTMAFVADVVLQTTFQTPVRLLASFRIETDATVEKMVGERSVTKVNVALLVGTFGSALGLMVGVAVVTFTVWMFVVWKKGRKGYNSFCSAADALACAAQQFHWAEECNIEEESGAAVGAIDGVLVREARVGQG